MVNPQSDLVLVVLDLDSYFCTFALENCLQVENFWSNFAAALHGNVSYLVPEVEWKWSCLTLTFVLELFY